MLTDNCCVRRKHDMKAGPRTVRRTADGLRAVAADNGFQDWHSKYEIAALNLDYLVQHRGSTPQAAAKNALIQAKSYIQRWMPETSYSTVRRTQDFTLDWQF